MKIKNILTILMAAVICKSSAAQFEGSKQVFSSPKLKAEIPTYKTVAILPFNAAISYTRLPKNFDEDEFIETLILYFNQTFLGKNCLKLKLLLQFFL